MVFATNESLSARGRASPYQTNVDVDKCEESLQCLGQFNAYRGPDSCLDDSSSHNSGHESPSLADGMTEAGQMVALQVGERTFKTSVQTLCSGSQFFKAMFSGRWSNAKQPDGSYFIDADPESFEHILRYLRQRTMPILLQNGSHDYGMYKMVLDAARYFQVDQLEKWIVDQEYKKTVKVVRTAFLDEDIASLNCTEMMDTEIECYPFFGTRKIYICPRGIMVHRGNRLSCGRACAKAQVGCEVEYEEENFVRVLIITKRLEFNPMSC